MAINKIQIEKLRHNKVDQYAHSLIREIAFIDYEIGMQSTDPSIPDVVYYYSNNRKRGVYNIVTKKYSGGKPTRISFDKSIEILRDKMIENDDKFLAIPLIGGGLDRLSWAENRETLQRVFADTDIEILVCKI